MKIDRVEPAVHAPAKQPCEHSVCSDAYVHVVVVQLPSSAAPWRTFGSRHVAGAGESHVVAPHVGPRHAPEEQPYAQVCSTSEIAQVAAAQLALDVRSVDPLHTGAGAVHAIVEHASAVHAPFAQPFGQSTMCEGYTHAVPSQPGAEAYLRR